MKLNPLLLPNIFFAKLSKDLPILQSIYQFIDFQIVESASIMIKDSQKSHLIRIRNSNFIYFLYQLIIRAKFVNKRTFSVAVYHKFLEKVINSLEVWITMIKSWKLIFIFISFIYIFGSYLKDYFVHFLHFVYNFSLVIFDQTLLFQL